jgi:hypothetical protein
VFVEPELLIWIQARLAAACNKRRKMRQAREDWPSNFVKNMQGIPEDVNAGRLLQGQGADPLGH